MTNFGAKILNNAVSALRAQQAVIATVGNNIANVNTPGYSRRVLTLQTAESRMESSGVNVGNGVRMGRVERIADSFIQKTVWSSASDKGTNELQNEFLARIEKLFNLTGERVSIGSAFTGFFTAMNDLSANPSSIELRSNVLQRAQDLVSSIKDTYSTLSSLQQEADQRLVTEINTVNALTSQIASVNDRIRTLENNGTTVAADERDLRDSLVQDLAEKISFSTTEHEDGTITLTLSNGFPLVHGGTSRELEVTSSPTFGTPGVPTSLYGGTLSYIVYNQGDSTTPSHVDLTPDILNGGGSIGGLLAIRGYADSTVTNPFDTTGIIPEIAARIESLTRALLVDFNRMYQGPDLVAGGAFQPSAGDLDGNPPAVFGLFDFDAPAGTVKDGDGDGRPSTGDLNAVGFSDYSSRLKLSFTDPRQFAAALGTANPTPPPPLIIAPGDGRNIIGDTSLGHAGMASLQNATLTLSAGGVGFALDASVSDAYTQYVGYVGNLRSTSDVAVSVASDNLESITQRRDEISAVSLDEEFTSLITFQKAYQASAKMIRMADELLDQILQLL